MLSRFKFNCFGVLFGIVSVTTLQAAQSAELADEVELTDEVQKQELLNSMPPAVMLEAQALYVRHGLGGEVLTMTTFGSDVYFQVEHEGVLWFVKYVDEMSKKYLKNADEHAKVMSEHFIELKYRHELKDVRMALLMSYRNPDIKEKYYAYFQNILAKKDIIFLEFN